MGLVMKISKKEQKKKTRIKVKSWREKKIAEGCKKYEFYLNSDTQIVLETIKSGLLYDIGKENMSQSELFDRVVYDCWHWANMCSAVQGEKRELKEKYDRVLSAYLDLLNKHAKVTGDKTIEATIKKYEVHSTVSPIPTVGNE